MSDAVIDPMPEAPRQKRKYTRHKPLVKKTPKIESPAPQPAAAAPVRRVPERALAEIDAQLTAAISSMPSLEEELTVIEGKRTEASVRLERSRQRITQLIGLQRQLNGESGVIQPAVAPPELDSRVAGMVPGWQKDIPPGVSSIPARQPKPSGGNAADQAKGGGWE